MLSWEVMEGQQHIAVSGQFSYGFIVFHAVGFDEEIKERWS
ncbi:hypothetical protein ROG8370_03603 [Roseovarius gaetbuli]|uniref:Uncharacterized protein n=1 Tax=Roseovarius gaetbuli TaxID=1356575 RepID=A0A1X7A930_9RHOB|nr:hypothetical protein ROG8370_03603 [Roseovarius gaetbuli]